MTDISQLQRNITLSEAEINDVELMRAEQPEFDKALGYLVTWGIGNQGSVEPKSQTSVHIHVNRKQGEMIASYTRSSGNIFVIAAIFHADKTVSFHS